MMKERSRLQPSQKSLMKRMLQTTVILAILVPCLGTTSFAKESEGSNSKPYSCGTLKKFDGDIQILGANRKDLLPIHLNVAIPCGAWITLKDGYAKIQHRNGFDIKLGPNTLVEIFDNSKNQHMSHEDHLVLFEGIAFVSVRNGSGEFRVITPNARARFHEGQGMVLYSLRDEESQLIALQKSATLENRFENKKKIKVTAGEATSLNFKYLRVIPSTPKTVSVASLKLHLNGLPLTAAEFNVAMDAVVKRANRTFAARVNKNKGEKGSRFLASTSSDRKKKKHQRDDLDQYVRHHKYSDDPVANEKWLLKVVGDDPEGKAFLYPERGLASDHQKKVFVKDLDSRQNPGWVKKEKQRLIKKIQGMEPFE